MENTSAEKPSPRDIPEEKQSNNKLVIILIVLLLAGNGIFGYLWWTEHQRANTVITEKETIIVERDNVKSELMDLKKQYETLQTDDKNLNANLEANKAKIDSLLEQAEKHKGDAYAIAKLKKETETLRRIMQHYVVVIDSLNTYAKQVVAEKEKVTADLGVEKDKSSKLSKDKEDLQKTVNMGSILKAENPTAKGVKFRSGGKKEIETTKASRVERIKVSFVIGENKIAKKGSRTVYVRVTTPDGKELCKSPDEGNMVKFNGGKGYYAAKQEVSYNNDDVAVDVLCANPAEFIPGKYLIDIICDDVIVGQTNITLK